MSTFLLVADSGRARIFRVRGETGRTAARLPARAGTRERVAMPRGTRLEEIEDLVSPNARVPRRNLLSDSAGRTFPRAARGSGPPAAARSRVGDELDPRETEAERFASSIARRLEAQRRAGKFDELRIAAAPRFLGQLRAKLSATTRRTIARELPRDLSRMTPAAIARALLATT